MVLTRLPDSFYPPGRDSPEQVCHLGSRGKIPALTCSWLDRKASRYRTHELETVRGRASVVQYRSIRLGISRLIAAAADAFQ